MASWARRLDVVVPLARSRVFHLASAAFIAQNQQSYSREISQQLANFIRGPVLNAQTGVGMVAVTQRALTQGRRNMNCHTSSRTGQEVFRGFYYDIARLITSFISIYAQFVHETRE